MKIIKKKEAIDSKEEEETTKMRVSSQKRTSIDL